jgi:hypothetical protein
MDKIRVRLERRCEPRPCPVPGLGDCLVFVGSDSGKGRGGGYGRITFCGVTHAVHRLAYSLHRGKLKPKFHVHHRCDVRKCCNPAHLEQVTQSANEKAKGKRWNFEAPGEPSRRRLDAIDMREQRDAHYAET